ncbi:putative oxidoreductase yrbE [Proteiniborus sp. DW1]|uniref:Gfo/Idh/MocA family protein n=1 Tax=Proteiniborus sp. DW1 TaxID=1889883 RepID=UPI00092E19F5|nr:Gfo/Idh/MocA family oxidoreductase [Proteiniborus sp. DW1]SCG83921.1 putative oxidoreductase yrbE [Proteiniborus sp. DW1]
MNKTMNIGIIGAGVVGERLINAIKRHPQGVIKGIYDVNTERLEEMSSKYNLITVKSYNELLEDKDIDIIYLAVPPKYHHPIAMDIIKSNKHFLCEKPLANSSEEAREMYEGVEKNKVINAMNFPTVYTSAFKKMNSLLEEGAIGDLLRVELHGYFTYWPRLWQQNNWIASREQGGFVREVFTHFVQMINRLFGEMSDITSFIEYPEDPTMSEIGIIARANLKNNIPVLFNGLSSVGMKEDLSFTIYGTEGTISLVNWRELWISNKDSKKEKLELVDNDHLVELLDEFFKAMNGEKANLVTFKEGYEAQKVIEKLLHRE